MLDLRASLVAAQATLLGAIERRETRGCHNRSDYPEMNPELNVNFQCRLNAAGEFELSAQSVAAVPEHLEQWVAEVDQYDDANRLLE